MAPTKRRRSGSPTRLIAAESIRSGISLAAPACCRLTRAGYAGPYRGDTDHANAAHERNEAAQLLRDAAKADLWVIEGTYGSLVNEICTDFTALIWLCLDEAECVENIRQRGIRRRGDAASFAASLDWASTYRSRQGPSSYIGHQGL
ncbi:hypothetical protein [Burkholderia sp. SCN-KJ]|uniref:hypothetical protein n=1 Tax=unclassified Burkholderia TaxID=2613784 RepID=UPI0035AF87B4